MNQHTSQIEKLTFDEIFSRRPTLEMLKKMERVPIYALMDNIRSLHNVGSIFRSSDGARLAKLFLCGYTACPPRREIDKTALGATDSVPWSYTREALSVVRDLKNKGIEIMVVEHTNKSVNYDNINYQFPLCLVFGNEVEGVSMAVVEEADRAIELPMYGLKQSLNVAVAYGVVLYHILGQYLRSHALNP